MGTHRNQRYEIERGFIPFHQDGELDVIFQCQICCPVHDRIGALPVSKFKGGSIAQAALLIHDLPAIRSSASVADLDPLIPAGSSAGPTITKSLYIRGMRSVPNPSLTNLSSSALA